MAKIIVHGGDFKGTGSYFVGILTLPSDKGPLLGETISDKQLEFVEIATEENIKKLRGRIGWGLVGGALAGPLGLVAGLLIGGKKKKEITFIAQLKDGRQFIATTDKETFLKLKGASLKNA